jgi:2'-5' RNA ligase
MRFVIITLPPRATGEQIEALRRPLNQAVGAREALRYPPHLTLRTGLVCPDDKAGEAARDFLAHAARFLSVPVRTDGVFYATYGIPGQERGLVGWSVEITQPLLTLHRGLLAYQPWAKGPQAAFRPHVTLAFDDLGAEQVEVLRRRIEAMPPLPAFFWTVDHVALYHERPEGWVEWDRVRLKEGEDSWSGRLGTP